MVSRVTVGRYQGKKRKEKYKEKNQRTLGKYPINAKSPNVPTRNFDQSRIISILDRAVTMKLREKAGKGKA